MGVESKTYQTLANSTALVSVVGTRIYPEHRPDTDSLPAVIFSRAPGGERVNTLSGYNALENVIIEIDVYATAIDARREAGDLVIAAMTGSTRFSCLLPDPPFDDYDPDTRTYERSLQFSVWNHTT